FELHGPRVSGRRPTFARSSADGGDFIGRADGPRAGRAGMAKQRKGLLGTAERVFEEISERAPSVAKKAADAGKRVAKEAPEVARTVSRKAPGALKGVADRAPGVAKKVAEVGRDVAKRAP